MSDSPIYDAVRAEYRALLIDSLVADFAQQLEGVDSLAGTGWSA
ncbi:MAG TPA: hypothetical protein VFJ14_06840 [Nocardioidaceae bacterium]|nr:hypothetical protein [Nocardioidaceae bacterium]